MASEGHIQAEVLTPEGRVFEGELFQVSLRTVAGLIGIRARHVPVLARLVPTEMRLYESESDFRNSNAQRYAAAEGWVEVFANKVVVLVEEAHPPESLDVSELQERRRDAEQRLSESDEETAAHEAAQQDIERLDAFLEIAGGN